MKTAPINCVDFAKALADDTRQQIMRLCCCSWLSVGDIVTALQQVSQPTVSHHLGVLRAAHLVKARREGKQVYYTLNQENLAQGCCMLAADFAPDHHLALDPPEG